MKIRIWRLYFYPSLQFNMSNGCADMKRYKNGYDWNRKKESENEKNYHFYDKFSFAFRVRLPFWVSPIRSAKQSKKQSNIENWMFDVRLLVLSVQLYSQHFHICSKLSIHTDTTHRIKLETVSLFVTKLKIGNRKK